VGSEGNGIGRASRDARDFEAADRCRREMECMWTFRQERNREEQDWSIDSRSPEIRTETTRPYWIRQPRHIHS
jgi:hypothetical protein